MFKLTNYLKLFKKQVILGPLFKLLEAIFELIVPLVMAKIIDVGIQNRDLNYILKMGGLLILLGVVGLASAITCQYFASVASQGIGTHIRKDLFKHINSLSHSEIDNIGTPSLITRITNDVNQIQSAVAMLIRLAVRAPFLIIGSTVMSMMINMKLSIIFIATIFFIAFVLYMVMSKSIPFFTLIQKKLDKISLITRESLEGARVVRAFSKEESEKKRFREASDELSSISITVGKISALLNPLTSIIINFSIAILLWFGGFHVYSGNLTQGEVIAFVNYMTNILLVLIVVANLIVIFSKAFASIKRVNEIFEIKSTITENKQLTTTSNTSDSPKIEFKNVSFLYDNSNEKSLNNLSIKINRGEIIGIIGGTGSGKSTLVNLIPRFYDVSEGSILIDGIDVKDYALKDLRTQIGVVPQKAVLFSGTIRENLYWGLENATDAEIKKSLEIAQASEFVKKLPEGYETIISQGGKNLSGGQKQRLTIARALINNPEILILDDSASALDFATDAKLREAITTETKDTTIIIVSQRASTIRNADKIIVLDGGDIQGIGNHEELMKTCEVYKEIYSSQLSVKEVAI
ncbi:ABC transporter ATP-binding protein/permease [Clostridium sp. SHJSY1]|uniref:ABC transporter ATP-binding protein n=1 Tax=Clostridium sp. SHJSY1 TaxID=2942483 RepID=UPI0028742260|nr:ABC transporter ATP-binding protein [Clostridium sp. SHJSY1]MDS0526450.1 ABC transporter ATP-binding protein/permease [Clostridium sp. SHJSY1]